MKRHRFLLWLASALLLVVMVVAIRPQASVADSPTGVTLTQDPAVRYCLDSGGVGHLRFPAFGTNNATFTRLAGERPFCQFTAEDGTKIFVDIDTLYSEEPTMAALTYLTAPAPFGSG